MGRKIKKKTWILFTIGGIIIMAGLIYAGLDDKIIEKTFLFGSGKESYSRYSYIVIQDDYKDMLVYRSSTGSGNEYAKYQTRNTTGFQAEAETTIATTSDLEYVRILQKPESDSQEKVMCIQTIGDEVECQVWDGSSWGNANNVGGDGAVASRSYDICYESQSKELMVFYSDYDVDATQVHYAMWDGSWNGVDSLLMDVGAGKPETIRCIPQEGTDYIAIMEKDDDDAIWLAVWNGTGVEYNNEVHGVASSSDIVDSFHGAWESLSGDQFIMGWYADGVHAINGGVYTKSTKGFVTKSGLIPGSSIPSGEVDFVEMESIDGTDIVLLAVADDDDDIEVNTWDGDAWGTAEQISSNVGGSIASTGSPISLEYDEENEVAIVVYGATGYVPYYSNYTVTNGWGGNSVLPTVPNAEGIRNLFLFDDPFSKEMFLIEGGLTNDVNYLEWNGTDWDSAWTNVVTTSEDSYENLWFTYDYEDEFAGGGDNVPTVTLSRPEDNNVTEVGQIVEFEINTTDVEQLENVTLYVWNSSNGLITTDFIEIIGTFNSTIFTFNFTFSNSTHWNALVYDNASQGSWASANFSLNITVPVPVTDTCTCPGLNQDWEIDMSDYCNITDGCELGTGNLNFTGVGTTICDASVNTTNMGDPRNGGILQIDNDCLINII